MAERTIHLVVSRRYRKTQGLSIPLKDILPVTELPSAKASQLKDCATFQMHQMLPTRPSVYVLWETFKI